MRIFHLCFLLLFIAASCSSESDEWLFNPDNLQENSLVTLNIPVSHPQIANDSSMVDHKSRGWESLKTIPIYLFASGSKIIDFNKTVTDGGTTSIELSLYVDAKQQIHLKNNSQDVVIGGTQNASFFLSSIKNGLLQLENEGTTSGGKTIYKPLGDKYFKSELIEVSYDGNTNIYTITSNVDGIDKTFTNESGEFTDGAGLGLEFQMIRRTSKIRANLIITDYWFSLTEKDFKKEVGSTYDRWKLRPFLYNVPVNIDAIGNSTPFYNETVVAITNQTYPFRKDQEIGKPIDITSYRKGVGMMFSATDAAVNAFVFPSESHKDPCLCYTFYYKKNKNTWVTRNTLMISFSKLNNLSLDPNVENDVTVVIHVNDFAKWVKGTIQTSRSDEHIDPVFGRIMDIPYEVIVNKK